MSAGGQSQALAAEGVSVRFTGVQALDDVSIELHRGEALGLIGPNGAGKSTLVNVLSGHQPPDSGRVVLGGRVLTGMRPHRVAATGVGRTFQSSRPFAQMTVRENVAIGGLGRGLSRRRAFAAADELLERFGLAAQAEWEGGSLALVQERTLEIARSLATEPAFLLLDEPGAGLGPDDADRLVALLREVQRDMGAGILVIDHDMDVIMNACDRIQVLDSGRTLAAGTPEEIRRDPAVLEAYLGTAFREIADA